MSVRDTSLTAYQNTYRTGQAHHKRFKVFECIRDYPTITRQQISDRTGIPINVVCPRVLELLDSGMVKEDGMNGNNHMLVVV